MATITRLDVGRFLRVFGAHAGQDLPVEIGGAVIPTFDITPYLLGSDGSVVVPAPPLIAAPRGLIRKFALTQPLAGADFRLTVPSGKLWILHNLYFRFVQAGGVPTRNIRLALYPDTTITDGTETLWIPSFFNLASAVTWIFNYSRSTGNGQSALATEVTLTLPESILMIGTDTLASVTAGIQATDQFTRIQATVEEFSAQVAGV